MAKASDSDLSENGIPHLTVTFRMAVAQSIGIWLPNLRVAGFSPAWSKVWSVHWRHF